MSDRVAIIGGSEVGRDHFPVRPDLDPAVLTLTVPVGEKTNYPIGIDLDTMAKWFYRARKWSVSIVVGFDYGMRTGGFNTPHVVTITFDLVFTVYKGDFIDFEPTRESDLVLGREGGASWQDYPDAPTNIDDNSQWIISNYTSDNNVVMLGFSLGVDQIPTFKDGLFYPRSFFTVSRTEIAETSGNHPNNIGNFTVDGETASIFASDYQDNPPWVHFTSCNVSMTPTEFWSYAAKADGSPIYNTSNGSQLQSPFN